MIRPTTAFVNSVGNLGGFFGPNMIGWLKDTTGSFTAGLYGLAGMLTLAALSVAANQACQARATLSRTIDARTLKVLAELIDRRY